MPDDSRVRELDRSGFVNYGRSKVRVLAMEPVVLRLAFRQGCTSIGAVTQIWLRIHAVDDQDCQQRFAVHMSSEEPIRRREKTISDRVNAQQGVYGCNWRR